MADQLTDKMRAFLRRREFEPLLERCRSDRAWWKSLRACLYDTEEKIYWPAIEALGRLMEQWWRSGDEERVREYLRNLLWSLNEESGGIGWNAPQSIAEVVALIPELAEPYGTMMLDRTLKEPLLVKNGLWGLGRMGKAIQNHLGLFEDTLLEKLRDGDPQTAGTAAWASGEAGFTAALPRLEALQDRQEPVTIYRDGELVNRTLGQWSREATGKLNASG